MSTRSSIAGSLALALGLLAGCDRDARTRSEARMFLALYEATDHRAPGPERKRKLAQLEQLSLSDEAVTAARDQCVAAHKALLASESSNERAASALEQALATQSGGEPLDLDDTARIRAGIDKAERELSDARTRFERCESQVRDLSLRFGER